MGTNNEWGRPMNKDINPIRIDEMGIEVCLVCDCAIEHNSCLCDMRGWWVIWMKIQLKI